VHRKVFHCLSAACAWAGRSPAALVAGTLGISRRKALELIAAAGLGVAIGPAPALADDDLDRTWRDLPDGTFPYLAPICPSDREYQYLIGRGVLPEHIAWLAPQRVIPSGRIGRDGRPIKADRMLSDRVLFPLWTAIGRPIFWVARSVSGDEIKTLNMPRSCRGHDHSPGCTCFHEDWGLSPIPSCAEGDEVVMGLHGLRRGQPAIWVEGPIDVAVCGPSFVSGLGAKASTKQALQVAETGVSEVIVLLDGDPAGRKATPKVADVIAPYVPTRIAWCPEGFDPGELGRERSLAIALAAPPIGGLVSTLSDRLHVDPPRGTSRSQSWWVNPFIKS
jgi:hypothetical protein